MKDDRFRYYNIHSFPFQFITSLHTHSGSERYQSIRNDVKLSFSDEEQASRARLWKLTALHIGIHSHCSIQSSGSSTLSAASNSTRICLHGSFTSGTVSSSAMQPENTLAQTSTTKRAENPLTIRIIMLS